MNKDILALAMPDIEKVCEDRKERLIKKALEELRAQKMTPERAMHLWMEVNAADGFARDLRKKLTVETVNG